MEITESFQTLGPVALAHRKAKPAANIQPPMSDMRLKLDTRTNARSRRGEEGMRVKAAKNPAARAGPSTRYLTNPAFGQALGIKMF
jgi:hypothetical protein